MSKEIMSYTAIKEVFASREAYDRKRYIPRRQYEIDLERAIDRFRYIFITGESGSGKTWLANNYISCNDKECCYINLAEVGLQGGLLNYLKNSLPEIETEKKKSLNGKVGVPFVSGGGENSSTYTINNDFLWDFIESNEGKIVVLDNFESIIGINDVLNDISCLITLSDDPRMKDFDPKFLIIGALRDVVRYFQTMPNYQTIANRIRTVTIKGFTDSESYDFVKGGLLKCNFSITGLAELAKRIYSLTDGIPQAVNEMCYDIAISHFDENKTIIEYPSDVIYRAELKWLKESMLAEYSVINSYFIDNINNNDSLLNYILYALGELSNKEFSVSRIKNTAETLMEDSTRTISITKAKEFLDMLADEKENRNLLIKTNNEGYRIKSYKTMACILIVLDIDNNQVKCINAIDL